MTGGRDARRRPYEQPPGGVARERAEAALAAIRAAGGAGPGWEVSSLERLEGGFSRQSFTLGLRGPGGEARELVVRVRAPGALLDTDIGQEHRTYTLLRDSSIPVPNVHGLEESPDNPFGGPFFVMDRAPGRSPNVWRRRDREALERNWEEGGSIGRDLVRHLGTLHSIPAEGLRGPIAPRGYIELVAHWQGVHETVRLIRDPIVEEAYAWLLDRDPGEVEPCLVHADYRVGNCLIERGRIAAILDWELCFVGDPRFDLGYLSLDYQAGRFLRPGSRLLGAVADRGWFYSEYERLSGRAVDREGVRTFSVLGALMLIAILATGVRMYADGRTDDIRMLWSRFAVPGLRQELTALMDW